MKELKQNKNNILQVKSKFITDILDYSIRRKIDEKTKEKLINLISKEFEKTGIVETEIIERLEQIEKSILNPPTCEKKTNTTYHSPIQMVRFLNKFSKDDKFKWFTHDPESIQQEFNYENYILEAKKYYPKEINFNFLTYSNIKQFLFEVIDGKGLRRKCYANDGPLKYTWPDVREWCKNNPNTHPFFAQIGDELFSKYINQFKHIIEFRPDIPDLTFHKRTKDFIRKKLGADFQKTFTNEFDVLGIPLSIYIDTNLFYQGLTQILNWINDNKAKSNKVSFNIIKNDEYYQLEIFHVESYYSYNPDNVKLLGQQGDFEKARKFLFCVADWDIEASFLINNTRSNYRISCLNSETFLENKNKIQTMSINTIDKLNYEVGGVKHILKLYNTQKI